MTTNARRLDVRMLAATATSKALTVGIRRIGRGGGTALPGLVANTVDPRLLDKLAARLPAGAIVVAGTNGKTTTSRMLASMLEQAGRIVVHNRSGSNLVRGITAAFAEQLSITGSGADIAVIETDENAFPDVVRRVSPRIIVLLNLFRDQLDRYGELETIANHWRTVTRDLGPETTLIVNVDDPNLAALASDTGARVLTFGLADSGYTLPTLPHASDAAICRVCETPLVYDALFLSHLGVWRCPACGNHRPQPDFTATNITLRGVDKSSITIDDRRHSSGPTALPVDLALPGLYNVYNALAAAAVARTVGIEATPVRTALAQFRAAFGRLEQVTYQARHLTLALSKNPVGFNEILRMIGAAPITEPLVIAINDLDADGRDVSWLWDVDFEILAEAQHTGLIFAAGIRGYDLAVRLKYAGVSEDRINTGAAELPLEQALDLIVQNTQEQTHIFMLLTYTALLQLRQVLADRGAVQQFWEQ